MPWMPRFLRRPPVALPPAIVRARATGYLLLADDNRDSWPFLRTVHQSWCRDTHRTCVVVEPACEGEGVVRLEVRSGPAKERYNRFRAALGHRDQAWEWPRCRRSFGAFEATFAGVAWREAELLAFRVVERLGWEPEK